MKLEFEYGQGLLGAELPDSTDIFIPGETVADPPCLPQDWDSLYAATLASIRNPIGMPPLKELAGPGKSVVIVIPDIVKGGNQPTSHRKVAIRACLDELYAAGVEQKDVLLLFSNGLHPRATVAEMQTILGPELFGEFYPTGQITSHDSEDYDQMEEVALREKPKMIIGGGSAYSREWDYKRMREIADKIGAILMIDMAHPAGLIAAGELDNPVKYAHIVTSTTHKTLRGPRGGVIMMGKDFPNPWGKKTPKGEIKMMSQLLDSAVFPGIQGGPLEHVIAAKAVAFGEILQPEWKEYAKQVKKNAAVLAQALIDRGFTIVSGGTDNHSMLVDLRSKYPDLTGKVAEKALVSADITVNKNMVPFDSRSAFQTSGIRLGTPAITTRGAKEDLMLEIAEMIETVLSNVENEEVIAQVRARVNETMKKYPLFAY